MMDDEEMQNENQSKRFVAINFSRKGLRVRMRSITLTDNHLYISLVGSVCVFFSRRNMTDDERRGREREKKKRRTDGDLCKYRQRTEERGKDFEHRQ